MPARRSSRRTRASSPACGPDELAARSSPALSSAAASTRDDRGRDRRLRLPGGRAGHERRRASSASWPACRARSPAPRSTASAARRCRRCTSAAGAIALGCRRGVHLRRRRVDDARAVMGLQLRCPTPASPRATRRPTSRWARPPRTSRERFGVARGDQEEFAVAVAAQGRRGAGGRAASTAEIVPVARRRRRGRRVDGCLRPGTTAEVLAALRRRSAQDGSVTAGTSSPLTDGAAACSSRRRAYAGAQRTRAAGAHPRLRRLRLRPRDHGHRARSRPRARCSSAPA